MAVDAIQRELTGVVSAAFVDALIDDLDIDRFVLPGGQGIDLEAIQQLRRTLTPPGPPRRRGPR